MVSGRVLRIPRTDDNDSFVLARVEQTGSSVLDLRLTGTDGVEAFVGQIRQNGITKLQSKNYHGTSREWTATLSAILLKQKDAVSEVKDVEIVAALEARRIILVIRKNIDGITVRRISHSLPTHTRLMEYPATSWQYHNGAGRRNGALAV